MKSLSPQQLIQVYYAGEMDRNEVYLNLIIEAGAVLFVGIIMWRGSIILLKQRRKQLSQRQRFETRYSKTWKNKN